MKITLGAEAAGLMKRKSFSHQHIIEIIGERNLSDITARGLVTDIRKVMGRRAVEKGLDKALFQKTTHWMTCLI